MNQQEFKKLQNHWYNVLADSGFRDIERITVNADPYRGTHPIVKLAKEEYFQIIEFHSRNEATEFRSDVDRYILTRYSDGVSYRAIAKELKSQGTSRSTKWIGIIVRRYEKAWGIM